MLRSFFKNLIRPSGDLPRAPGLDSSSLDSPYLERAAGESAGHHALRLQETRMLLKLWEARHREWRAGTRRHRSGSPAWDGQPLAGRTVLVHDWPGLGDSINFVRFVPWLKKLQADVNVIAEVQQQALGILGRAPGVDGVALVGNDAAHDYHVPGTTLLWMTMLDGLNEAAERGSAAPYLSVDTAAAARWAPRLADLPRPRIGLCWAGNPANRNDAIRSMPLRNLEPLLRIANRSFVSLQVGAAAVQAGEFGNALFDVTRDIGDLEDTAAIIEQLDLVVSIDSTVAHLAGALGKPVWVLRSAGADRRWDLVSADAHWYPGLRVFGTAQPGVWTETIPQVCRALAEFG